MISNQWEVVHFWVNCMVRGSIQLRLTLFDYYVLDFQIFVPSIAL